MARRRVIPMLFCLLLLASTVATAAPIAASFKSIANITSVGPGTNTCPAGLVPIAVSGSGTDTFGAFTITEQICSNPTTGEFSGQFNVAHSSVDSFFGHFNGAFVPSGQGLEAHAFWRISGGKGQFSGANGAGTAKGVGSIVNGAPGPGSVLLDGSLLIRDQD